MLNCNSKEVDEHKLISEEEAAIFQALENSMRPELKQVMFQPVPWQEVETRFCSWRGLARVDWVDELTKPFTST